MTDVIWGEPAQGVRLGLRMPGREAEAGGTIVLELIAENVGREPAFVFGFRPGYPRSLRVSPPKQERPYIRVSFGDVNVFHPPEAFVRLGPGEYATTWLDLSFAFDRRGAGVFSVAFAYDAVRASGGFRTYTPERAAQTGLGHLLVARARLLREAGIDETVEQSLDALVLSGDASIADRLRSFGTGGAAYAARRVSRVLTPGGDAMLGWKAFDALELLGEAGLVAASEVRRDLPHAETALAFAEEWLAFRCGRPTPYAHLPFVTELEQISTQPDRRGNFALSWIPYDSPVHGTCRMDLFGSGERVVMYRAPGASMPTTRRTTIPPMQMQALFDALRFAGVWLLRPLRAVGLPDEPQPTLDVRLALGAPFQRQIAMWNGEWRQGPAFRLADMLDRIASG